MKDNELTLLQIASNSTSHFFEEIRKRPSLWIGKKSLIAFEAFWSGIFIAEMICNVPEEKQLSGFNWTAFEEWVDKKYNLKKLTVKSFYHAKQMASSDENAFDKWYEIYDLYKKEKQE